MLGISIIAISMTARIAKSFFRDFGDVDGGGGGGGISMLSLIFPKLIFNIHYILFGINAELLVYFFLSFALACQKIRVGRSHIH